MSYDFYTKHYRRQRRFPDTNILRYERKNRYCLRHLCTKKRCRRETESATGTAGSRRDARFGADGGKIVEIRCFAAALGALGRCRAARRVAATLRPYRSRPVIGSDFRSHKSFQPVIDKCGTGAAAYDVAYLRAHRFGSRSCFHIGKPLCGDSYRQQHGTRRA